MSAPALPDRYAVIGHPIAQSRSPWIHARFAADRGESISYTRIDPGPDGFEAAARAFFAGGGLGLNVTSPFKGEALAGAAQASDEARTAQAANALRARPDLGHGAWEATNFDGVGLALDLARLLSELGQPGLAGRRLLILGAGGATRGVLAPLLAAAPAALTIANRTAATAEQLARAFAPAHPQVALAGCGFDALDALPPFDVVLHATSASLHGQPHAWPASIFRRCALACDLSYGTAAQPFVEAARRHGASATADGLGMLVEQAAEAFAWWRGGPRPATAPVLSDLRAAMTAPAPG